ncbi:LysR family transcriptional regulator [Vibrio penaeicida]|uniref:LysR family transcriptional regulator n=2 Tax=Vibrio penaeicida TaxID=104609 RepID=A0AAV5NZK1_9VIBR|nr:LysR family transcriptional regulator [Vibrio penaeicida]
MQVTHNVNASLDNVGKRMNIESKWLEDFEALAEYRSFSKAAQLRNMTQPAFSRRIQSLEEALGSQLIDRSKVPIELTPSGRVFRTSARNLLIQITDSVDQLLGISRLDGNVVKIAAAHSLASSLVPKLHAMRNSESIKPVLSVEAIDVDRAIEALQQGECDILLAFDDERLRLPPYMSLKVGDAELLPVCACNENGQAIYQLESQETIPCLAYSLNSYMGRQVEKVRPHSNLDVVFTSSMTDLLKTQVLNGAGVAWLPDYAIQKELRNNELTVVGADDLICPISFYAYRYQARLHKAGEHIWHGLRELAAVV